MEAARPLLIFDGDCAFCTSAAGWAEKGWRGTARAVPWQRLSEAELDHFGLSVEEARSAAWWIGPTGRRFRGHRAIGMAMRAGSGPRRLTGTVILFPPLSWAASVGYRLVVRFRHHLPGSTPACRIE